MMSITLIFRFSHVTLFIELALNTENTTVEQMTMDVINVRLS
jgi:hypothetical protein